MWKDHQNRKKIVFLNTIKSKEQSIIYKDFTAVDEISIQKILKKKSCHMTQKDRKKDEIKPYRIKTPD